MKNLLGDGEVANGQIDKADGHVDDEYSFAIKLHSLFDRAAGLFFLCRT